LTLHTPVQLVAVNAPFSWFAHHHKTRKEKDMSCARVRWKPMTSPLAPSHEESLFLITLSFSVESSEVRRAVHGISHTHPSHTLYTV